MTLEDLLAIEEIRSLRAEYSAHFDTRNVAALAGLFTDDAVCEFGHYGEWRGLEQIRANYAGVIAAIPAPFDTLHVATNGLVRLRSPTTAAGRWYLMDLLPTQVPGVFETRGGHAQPLLYLGIYEDDYRKVDGRWRFAHVKLHFLWPNKTFTALRHPDLA